MRRAHTAVFAAVCVIWLASCGREPVAPIRIGTFPGPASELVFFAQHRGWLPSSDYRLVEFINDGEVMRAFRNGSIEAGLVSLDEVLSLAQSGMDPVILFVTAESRGGDAIVAHADVTALADLRGRRVAVQVNSVSAYLLRRSLQTAGLAAKDLQIVNLPPDRHRAAFMRRDVDAVVTTEPVRTEILTLGGVELFNSASLPLELMGVTIISGAYLEQHGARASALCTAWRQAESEIGSSADARAWVAARMKVTPETLGTMLDVVRLIRPSESHALLGLPRPRLMATAARIQTELLDSGLLPTRQSLDPIFRWPVGIDRAACRG
jgi:NitT/TauT family transport system substrate-binding protein